MSQVNFWPRNGRTDADQVHKLPASLSDPVDSQLGVSFDKDFALLYDTVYYSEQCRTASINAQINTDQNRGICLKNLSMLISVEECGTKSAMISIAQNWDQYCNF